jgi:hypothetical protein
MLIRKLKTEKQISGFLDKIACNQNSYEQKLSEENRKKTVFS